MSTNRLTSVPDNIGSLIGVTECYLQYNCLTKLPVRLASVPFCYQKVYRECSVYTGHAVYRECSVYTGHAVYRACSVYLGHAVYIQGMQCTGHAVYI